MKIQDTTFLRRAVGGLLVALVTLFGFHAHAQLDFNSTTTVIWYESHGFGPEPRGGTSLRNVESKLMNALVPDALTNPKYASTCFVLVGTPAAAIGFDTSTTDGDCRTDGRPVTATDKANGKKRTNLSLKLKAGKHVDYESGSRQELLVGAYSFFGGITGAMKIHLRIIDYDEQAFLTEKAKTQRTVYVREGHTTQFLASQYFKDPEGAPIRFDSTSDSSDVWVCDTDAAGNFTFASPPGPNAYSTVAGSSHVDIDNDNCSPSNTAPTASSPGFAGKRVLTTRKVGPVLQVTVNSLVEDLDGDPATKATPRPQGTYAARVYFRAWSKSGFRRELVSADWAKAEFRVKIGANNRPQFAGGATGFSVDINEAPGMYVYGKPRYSLSKPQVGWVANDLDEDDRGGTNMKDTLRYSLAGQNEHGLVYVGGGAVYIITKPEPTKEVPLPPIEALQLVGINLDYERRSTTFAVTLNVTDEWLDKPVSIPISVRVKNVNELYMTEEIPAQKLVQGMSKTIDLNAHILDPERDSITYAAYSNVYTDVVELRDDGTLKVTGRGTTSSSRTSTVQVTVSASDGKGGAIIAEFDVLTRLKNVWPKISLVEEGTISIGTSVFEAGSAGKVLLPLIEYKDDDPPPVAIMDEGLFKAVVNPCMSGNRLAYTCGQGFSFARVRSGVVAIVVGNTDLNYEEATSHTLKLSLRDSWEEERVSKPLTIQVGVHNSNDAPTVVKDAAGERMKIDEQMIVINGSGSISVGSYFEDEDGDRLLVSATSNNSKIATVKVSGLDDVTFNGVAIGEARVTLTAEDPGGATASLSFKVTVSENNDPIANEDVFKARLPVENTINVGATADIELDGLFSDKDGGDMVESVTATTSDESVLLVVATNDGKTATLVGRKSGTADLTITATDKAGNSAEVSTKITVNAVPEEAMPLDPQTLNRITPLAVDVSEIFSDSDDGADSLVITAATIGDGADRATVEVMDGTLTITGVMGIEPGDVEIKLTATDPHGSNATSTFVVTIENVTPTVAMSVEGQELDRTQPLTVDLNEAFEDADGTISTISAMVGEDSVLTVSEIDLEDGMLTITALAVGEETVTLTATDNDGGAVTSTFAVTVNNVNPIVANAITDQTTTRIVDLTLDVSDTFNDPDDESMLKFSVMSTDESIATVKLEDSTLTIEGLYVGSATITVTATDVDGGMVTNEFTVEIENVTPTVAMSVDDQSFDRRAPLGIDLSGNFSDADGIVSSIMAKVGDGSIVEAMVDENSMLSLTALAVGETTITLTATDDNGTSVVDEFVVTVVNIVPEVANMVPDQNTTRVTDLTVDISDTFNDPDASNDMLTLTAMVDDGTFVEAVLEGSTLTIKGLAVGTTNVTLTALDADGGMVETMFTATIENIDPVVANSVPDQSMDRRAPLSLDLGNTFSDEDGSSVTITVTIGSGAVLSAAPIEDSMLTLTALAVGETTITLTATDENGTMVTDEFVVTVVNIDPVVAQAVPDQTTTRVQDVTIDISGVFADPDADDGMLSIDVILADGTIVDATLSGSTLTIKGLKVGDTMLTLTATDADDGSVDQPFKVTIENVAPTVASSLSPISLEVGGQPASQTIAGLFSDDGDELTFTIATANSGIASASLTGMTAMIGPVSRGSASYTITASDPHGGQATVTGNVTVGDGELKAVAAKSLAGFGRALLASASSSVGSRVMRDARSSDLTLDAWAPVDGRDATIAMSAEDRSEAAWNVVNTTTTTSVNTTSGMQGSSMSGLDALPSTFGESFALNLGSIDNPSRWSVWGDVDRQFYEGTGYDGMASSVYLGADVTVAECWMFGVAVSSNSGESDYMWGTATQTMDLSLTTVLPYVSYRPNDGTSVWGVAGFGSGELDTTVVGASNDVSDLSSQLAMIGGSQNLTSVGRFDLALRGDAAMATLETDNGTGAADGLVADINRVRVGLEGSFKTETGQGGLLEPFGQVSLRSDGGDGDTGTGIEVAGGVRMTSSAFTLEVRGRTLAMHSADEYSESGFSLMATLNPSASATGVSVTVAPRWGADAQGTGVLWQDTLDPSQTYGALAGFANAGANASFDTQIGYGLLVANERYLFTPFVDLAVSDGDRRELLFGATLRQMAQGNASLDVNLALGRVEERTGASSGKIGLNATLRF